MNKKDGKKIQKTKNSDIIEKIKEFKNNNQYFFNTNSFIDDKNISTRNASIIFKNLKKYSITKKKYNIFIINSIIFDQKNHIVTEFKNNLYWDETSEFLKRFYYLIESLERLPNISQYYETYTLFAPIYFGLDCNILIIMNEWTIKKKNYLEYIEDKEEENENNKGNNNIKKDLKFKKLIKSNLVYSDSSNKQSKSSKKTLELTKYDNVDSFFINSIDLSHLEKGHYKNKKKENINNISLSKIMDDLFNNYSVYKINNNNNDEEKNKITKNISNNKKNEINKKENTIVSSDKVLFSFSNLYKNRNNKNSFQKRNCTNNTSTGKIKNEKKSKEKLFICKMNNKINIPLNETKKNNNKKKFNTQINNLQININNLTRNKSNIRDKKDKENIINNIISNTHINTTSYNNSTNNSLSKLKIRKQKIKKLFLRNLKLITPPYNYNRHMANSPETMDTNKIENNNNNNKKNKYNLTRLLTYKISKSKDLLNRDNINVKNFNSTGFIKVNNTQTNYEPFKISNLTKEKRVLTATNSFCNNKNNNSKFDKKNSMSKNKKKNSVIANKKLSNGNIMRNLVLNKIHSKKDIIIRSKKNNLNNNINNKMFSSLTKKSIIRNNTSLKSKKRTFTKKSFKKINESLSIKPYKKELNKINLNFNFNINFNIDINKIRQKKYLLTHKNIGYLTQRNQIIRGSKINKNKSKSKSKSKGGENIHQKNIMIALIKNIKKENYGLRKNIK